MLRKVFLLILFGCLACGKEAVSPTHAEPEYKTESSGQSYEPAARKAVPHSSPLRLNLVRCNPQPKPHNSTTAPEPPSRQSRTAMSGEKRLECLFSDLKGYNNALHEVLKALRELRKPRSVPKTELEESSNVEEGDF